jgi:hypothetical protein
MEPEIGAIAALMPVLPRPLALLLEGVIEPEARQLPVLLSHRLLEAGENGCKFWVAVAAGVQAAREAETGGTEDARRLVLGRDGPPDAPTFSDWLQALKQALTTRLFAAPGNLEHAARGWSQLLLWNDPLLPSGERAIPQSGVLAELLQGSNPAWWVQVRNLLAHTSSLTPRRAEELLGELIPPFVQALTLTAEALSGSEVVRWRRGQMIRVSPGNQAWDARILDQADARAQAVEAERAKLRHKEGEEIGLFLLVPDATGWRAIELWPLFMVGGASPKNPLVGVDPGLEAAINVFWRVQKDDVYFDPHGDEAVIRRGGPAELSGYRSRFRNPPVGISDYQVDLWAEIEEEARAYAGRTAELELVVRRLKDEVGKRAATVLFLTGEAGRGKSALLGQVALKLASGSHERRHQGRPLVVHRFRTGDRLNEWRAFVVLGLKQLTGKEPVGWTLNELHQAGTQFGNEIARYRPVVLLDGLDELNRVDHDALRELRKLSERGGWWLCTCRPDGPAEAGHAGPVQSLVEMGAERIWFAGDPEGQLPRLSQDDVRAIILKNGSVLVREELLRLDEDSREPAGKASNQLLENLERLGGNHPQYLLVWLDYLAGLSSREALWREMREAASREAPRLPNGLQELYQKLLSELGVGDVATYKTPALYMLAQAEEPLDAAMLSELYRARPADAERRFPYFTYLLGLFDLVLEPAVDSDGLPGLRIDNDSFRNFLARDSGSVWLDVQHDLASAALTPSSYRSSRRHLYRHGIAYLLRVGNVRDAIQLLENGEYLEAKLAEWEQSPEGLRLLLQDHSQVASSLKAEGREKSRQLADTLVAAISKSRGAEHVDTQVAKGALAKTLQAQGDIEGAGRLQEEAFEGLRRLQGEEHPLVLGAGANPASWADSSQLEAARRLLEDVLQGLRPVQGDGRLFSVAASLLLALMLRDLGEPQSARQLLQEAVESLQTIQGEQDPLTLGAKGNLAWALRDLGERGEARRLLEEVLDGLRPIQNDVHPYTLAANNSLAWPLRALGELEAVRRLLEGLLETHNQAQGGDSPYAVATKVILAGTLRDMGEIEAGRRLQEEAMVELRKAAARVVP